MQQGGDFLLSTVKSCALLGIDGRVVDVEVDISNGIPSFDIVGLGDAAVRESRERVRAAIKNSGFEYPVRRITVNLAPANLRKEGSSYDLAVAIGILYASGQLSGFDADKYMFVGELSLDGEIKPVNGALSMAACAQQNGIENLVLPVQNADEAAVVKGVNILPAGHILEVADHLQELNKITPHKVNSENLFSRFDPDAPDFADVKGQDIAKRALEVAASGGHNVLMVGPAGSGKTMLARRLPGILPSLTFEEAIEVTKIYSIAGLLPPGSSLITKRPFRNPHHTISAVGLTGGGKIPKPGEISLSHYGVLFLDELPEFGCEALEALRQPLEDGSVTVARLNASITYPARFMLLCAANPCKCGNYLSGSRECTCSPQSRSRYLGRLSAPLLDRIDIQIEISPVKYTELGCKKRAESSRAIRKRVEKAREIQLKRYRGTGIYSNSQLKPPMIDEFCVLDGAAAELLGKAFESLGLSARAHDRILKVARTIADLDESETIRTCHVAEAMQYRSLDRKLRDL